MWMLLPAVFFLSVLCLGIVWLRRARFPHRPDAGPYYIADGRLVLNYKIPEAHALCRIARVELSLRDADDSHENLLVHVLLRNGKKYSYQFRNAPPGFAGRWQRRYSVGTDMNDLQTMESGLDKQNEM